MEDLNKLKKLLKLKVGTYNDKRINSYEKYIDKLSRNKNLLHFAILNNQENIEIIEYLSLINDSCLLNRYNMKINSLSINGLIQRRKDKPAFKNDKYKKFTKKNLKFFNINNSICKPGWKKIILN